MAHPKTVGDRSTLAVMLALQGAGCVVLVPFGENVRYDVAIDDGRRLARVQRKTGRLRGGAVRFSACSSYAHHPRPHELRRDYLGEIDYFGICLDTGDAYLVPIEDVQVKRQGALRVERARNGQRQRIRSASEYKIGSVLVQRPNRPAERRSANASLF